METGQREYVTLQSDVIAFRHSMRDARSKSATSEPAEQNCDVTARGGK